MPLPMLAAAFLLFLLPVALTTAFSRPWWNQLEDPWQFVSRGLLLGYAIMGISGWLIFGRYLSSIGISGVRSVPPTPWWNTLGGRFWLFACAFLALASLSHYVLRNVMRKKQ
jgi:hypothetical protein